VISLPQKRRCDIPRKSPYVISLSSHEESVLQQMARKYTLSYFKVVRAKAILLAADGLKNKQIGEKLDLPREIVSKWRKRFFEERLNGLQDRPRRGRPSLFPPKVVMEVKALACQLPCERDIPFSRLSNADIAREAVDSGIVASISGATVWRWLSADAIKPWQYRSWIFPRDPDFAQKAARVLDLYQGFWNGKRLRPNDYIISADEKTSIQARNRNGLHTAPSSGQCQRIEFEYQRAGALAYIAAWDVRRAKVFGLCAKSTGIEVYHQLVDLVMQQEPYRSANRVFWVTDNGSSHRGQTSVDRLAKWYPNAIQVHTPIHASWLNQIEIYFSVVQRKVLTPNDFPDLKTVEQRLLAFQSRYEEIAKPFKWKFTKDDLNRILSKLSDYDNLQIKQLAA